MLLCRRKPVGIILIVVLGVLALMSILAITFVSMTRLERSISRNYVDRTRAIMTAESGIEYAIKRIANFRGGVLTPREFETLQYQDGDYSRQLKDADKPSFQIPGKPYSSVVSPTYTPEGDRFKLKVADLSSRINLNDSNFKLNLPPTDPHYGRRRLSTMIGYLCELLFASSMGDGIGYSIANAIEMAKDKLPAGCFTSLGEVKKVLIEDAGFTESEWAIFQQYFTVHGCQDTTVLRPSFEVNISVPASAAPAPLYEDGGADLYLYMDMQTKNFATDKRSPININTAPKETIEMLFALVSGWFVKEGPAENLSNGHYGEWVSVHFGGVPFQYYYQDENKSWTVLNVKTFSWETCQLGKRNSFGVITRTIDFSNPAVSGYDNSRMPAIADIVWNRIHHHLDLNGDDDYDDPMENDQPKQFATWDEFHDFIKTVFAPDPDDGSSLLLPDDAALDIDPVLDEEKRLWWRNYYFEIYSDQFLANFNPNSQLNDYNPNLSIYRHIDKSQLATYTTELCFEPTGCFEIQSLGEITGTDGTVLAGSQINTIVEVFEFFRRTTQAQFMAGYDSEADLANYFSESNSIMKTALAGLSTSEGYSLQSYPEPATGDNYLSDSGFDGKLMLATWQPELSNYNVDVSTYIASGEVPSEIDTVEE
ncbi:PilX N-terminal domain-containing pilus assembly protein, partial [Planctomycetota bacterium]